MAPRKTLTDRGVQALRPRAKRYALPDPETPGMYVRVTPAGAKSFVAVTIGADGRQVWITVGKVGTLTIAEARLRAREAIKRVRQGLAAFEVPPGRPATFREIAQSWLTRKVRKDGFRSEGELTRVLAKYILPGWGDRPFVGIRRSDVTALMDHIEDRHGARTADYSLAVVSAIMNFHAARTDDYSPVVVRGMQRQSIRRQARKRILNDGEIRALWAATGDGGAFAGIVRLCLLTAQRSRKIAGIRWTDISEAGAWTVAHEAREKGTGGQLVLPPIALAAVRAQPKLGACPFVFPGARGRGPWQSWGIAKAALDAKMAGAEGASGYPWEIHDLRRTARSLMSRAGVRPDIAERVLGHVIGGVAETYDRHGYRDEKADALARLAALVDGIVHPRANVVPMTKR